MAGAEAGGENMRTSDIRMARGTEAFTDNMYFSVDPSYPRKVEDMSANELRRGLCQKSGGDIAVCKTCPGGCRWGLELVRREKENKCAETNK